MSDQATVLRGLMERQSTATTVAAERPATAKARSIAITSGKGGVGKSNIALNLAIALSETKASVCLLDANPGVGNIDLLCGLNGYWNLSHVITGARMLKDIVLDGPGGVQVIPGASGLHDLADCPASVQNEIVNQLEGFEQAYDFIVIDSGSGLHGPARGFVVAADLILIVTTPEPTSVADAYATVKSLSHCKLPVLEALVNQADSPEQGWLILERMRQTARMFLRTHVEVAGTIPRDPCVSEAVLRRFPFLIDHPQCAASASIRRLARRLKQANRNDTSNGPFFPRLCKKYTRDDAA